MKRVVEEGEATDNMDFTFLIDERMSMAAWVLLGTPRESEPFHSFSPEEVIRDGSRPVVDLSG
jgi:hypothetical protein